MVTTVREKNKQPSSVVDEELRRMKQQGRPPERKPSPANSVLGIAEIVAGVAIMALSFVAGAVFSLFLGAVLALAGVLEAIGGSAQRSTAHIIVGILGAAVGVFILANPLVTFAFISRAIGLYLVVAGAVSFYRARRAAAGAAGPVIEVVIGLLALFNVFNIGFLAGLFLVILGIYTYTARGRQAGKAT